MADRGSKRDTQTTGEWAQDPARTGIRPPRPRPHPRPSAHAPAHPISTSVQPHATSLRRASLTAPYSMIPTQENLANRPINRQSIDLRTPPSTPDPDSQRHEPRRQTESLRRNRRLQPGTSPTGPRSSPPLLLLGVRPGGRQPRSSGHFGYPGGGAEGRHSEQRIPTRAPKPPARVRPRSSHRALPGLIGRSRGGARASAAAWAASSVAK